MPVATDCNILPFGFPNFEISTLQTVLYKSQGRIYREADQA